MKKKTRTKVVDSRRIFNADSSGDVSLSPCIRNFAINFQCECEHQRCKYSAESTNFVLVFSPTISVYWVGSVINVFSSIEITKLYSLNLHSINEKPLCNARSCRKIFPYSRSFRNFSTSPRVLAIFSRRKLFRTRDTRDIFSRLCHHRVAALPQSRYTFTTIFDY